MAKAVIAIDAWKLSIFERRLREAQYPFQTNLCPLPELVLIFVKTDNLRALEVVVRAANAEAAIEGTLQ